MKERDLSKLLHLWVIHGAPADALDDTDRKLGVATNHALIGSERSSNHNTGGLNHMNPDEPEYVSPQPGAPGRRPLSRTLVAAVAAVVLLISATAILAVTRSAAPELVALAPETESPNLPTAAWKAGPCAGPIVRGPQSERSAEQQAAAEQESKNLNEEIARTGFGFYSAPTQTGGWICGWVPVGTGIDGAKMIIADKGGEAVYDAPSPDGGILGFNFIDLGFFTVEEVQDPAFDPAQLRIQRYGCDSVTTESCRSSETILGNGQTPEYRQG